MWVVRLAHPVVNRFRVIAERTRDAAVKEAADQMKAWDAEFSVTIATAQAVSKGEKRWLNPGVMKQLLSPEHRLKQLAQQLTTQAQEELTALGFLLRHGTLIKYSADWSRDHSPFPEPAPAAPKPNEPPNEPLREWYASALILSSLGPSNRKIYEAEAEERFRAAHARWEQSMPEIDRRNREQTERFQRSLAEWEEKKKEWLDEQARRNAVVDEHEAAYKRLDRRSAAYFRTIINASIYPCTSASVSAIVLREPFAPSTTATEHPDTFPRTFELDYACETRTAIVDYELPAREVMPSAKGYKYVAAGDKTIPIPLPRISVEETYDSVLYQVTLRTIYELFRWDEAGALDSVVFNGWVSALDNATGRRAHTCILTIHAGKGEFLEINLTEVDPKACFRKLKGISGARLGAISAVRPILQMNREDKRFISSRPVMDALDNSTNLAAMGWEDFEQLIRDVFEKEFSGHGGEVKITRASRDHGVDAVAFDPDPIRGGKIVIQAKRYTDTVSVSSVRDLYGTILNEGANKGILVTTADYGPDAYEFAKGKPITLLSGSELLYLLQKYGHKARIDLAEARALAADRVRGDSRGHA
jgi:restriction system protein